MLFLISIRFWISKYDTDLLIHDFRKIYITIHVDNFRVTGPDLGLKNLDWLEVQITSHFDIKWITDGRYLDLKIDWTEDGISLFQKLFIDELLCEFKMENCHSILISLDPGFNPNTDPENDDTDPGYDNEFIKHNYQSDIRSL